MRPGRPPQSRPGRDFSQTLSSAPQVTDASLAHLAGLTELHDLTFMLTPVNGSGFKYLGKLRKLESLTIDKDGADHEAVEALKAAIPGLVIDEL